jgi:predicted nucleic acid-binding protein
VRYVLDCAVAVRWFVAQTHWEKCRRLLQRVHEGKAELIAPDVLVPEFGHVLRKLVIGKRIAAGEASQFMRRMLRVPIQLFPSSPLAPRALELALAQSGTFYDALYVALAEAENSSVVTTDDRMVLAFAHLARTIGVAELEL